MRKLKCLLGHKFISLYDVNRTKYENEKESITIIECKHCEKVLKKYTNYIKASFKNKEEKPTPPAPIVVKRY